MIDQKPRRSHSESEAPLDRLPPHAPEAEQGVIGCCLLSSECIGDAAAVIDVEAFYDLRHREIWNVLQALYTAKKTVDLIAVLQGLKDAGMDEQVGSLPYLMACSAAVPSAANLVGYVEIVRDKFMLRKLVGACVRITHLAYDQAGDATAVMAEAEREMLQISGNRVMVSEPIPMKELVRQAIDHVEDQFQRGKKFKVGPQTSWNYVNNIVPGFAPGDFVIVAGRPSTGKSAMAMQIAQHASMKEGVPVYVLSLEMTARAMALRELFQVAGGNLTKMRNGFLLNEDVPKLVNASAKLVAAPWWIESANRIYLEDLELKARRMKRKQGIGMLVVDYFQLLHMRARMEDRVKELNETSLRLKALAMELQIPVILCAQMNRNIETSEKRRPPMLSDLKDCGQLEQDADIVMMLWKPVIKEPTDPDSHEMEWLKRMPEAGVSADWMGVDPYVKEKDRAPQYWEKNLRRINCYVAKQREGRADEDAQLVFVKPWCRFVDAWRPESSEPVEEASAENKPQIPANEELEM